MKGVWIALTACALGCLVHGHATEAQTETVLYSFCSQQNCVDGQYPDAGVISVNGMLYGTTNSGGSGSCDGTDGCGTVFSLDPATDAETVLYSFQNNGTDGTYPAVGVINFNGMLYGTTSEGGAGADCPLYGVGCGTVFSLVPTTGDETVLYSFCSQMRCKDGYNPGGMIHVGRKLYGTTYWGGKHQAGAGISFDTTTGVEKALYSFFCSKKNCPDGGGPGSIIDVNGRLYGTTAYGGGADCQRPHHSALLCGTVFSLDPNTGVETVLHAFCSQTNCTDGDLPGGLINVKGTLYGITSGGGSGDCFGELNCGGTVFSLDPTSGAETVLYSFCSEQNCTDGENPAGLIDVNGVLYGTTSEGGTGNCFGESNCGGTVFSLNPTTGAETVLYSFCSQQNCTDGERPAGLINVNGTFYGITLDGGAYDRGAVFSIVR